MMAEEASNSSEGSLADFKLSSKDEWREFRTAAWLHDCGKVTTPEYIVDKATKLETIYNRIHEVRMRFEVLLRDEEIKFWRSQAEAQGEVDDPVLRKELEAKRHELKEEFAFIAECNLGGEFMSDEKIKRIQKIAQRTWLRHLDNRLGLGHLELQRFTEPEQALPCEEYLLSDRPEHIVPRPENCGSFECMVSYFAMTPPEHLYNLGEIYNLCTKKGTLTAEDRFKIKEHIIATINMLETLPYPTEMTRIPEYAGAHHETLIGTGYPRKLTADQISIPARIMTVADVFEALTASDRPYKQAKKLSEAVRILSFMVKDQHLDADIFKLFLESGIYKIYAERYLKSEQIDEVDVRSYVEDLEQ